MLEYLYVAIGGALGLVSKFFIENMLTLTFFTYFPIQIITVNIIECFLMGLIIEFLGSYYPSNTFLKLFLTTGYLGGFTTFSSFAFEIGSLTEKSISIAIIYTFLSVIVGIIAFFISAKIAKLI